MVQGHGRALPLNIMLDLLSGAEKVVLMIDGDEAGRRGGEQIANALKGKTELHCIRLQEGKEPEHLTRSEMKRMLGQYEMV